MNEIALEPFTLSKRYDHGSEPFSRVVLRTPTYEDYRKIGPAYDVQQGLFLPDREAIFAYIDQLVTTPAAHGALAPLSVEDAMGLEDHVLRFFIDSRLSLNRRTNSSSASDGPPATSMA